MASYDPNGHFIPIGGGRNPDGSTVNGGRPYSWNPAQPAVKMDGGGGLAAMLAPGGTWTSKMESTHPFTGLQDLLSSSILGRLMSQKGQEGGEIRGLQGGGVAWNHLEDPYGRVQTTTNTFQPAVVPPRKKFGGLADQLGNVFTKNPDANGWPIEANPGPWVKNGLRSDGTPMQYTNGGGQNIANPYL